MDFMTREQFDKLPKEEQDKLMATMKDIQEKLKDPGKKDLKQLTMKEFEEKIKGIIGDQIKAMTSVDRKYFKFPGIGNENIDDLSAPGKFEKTTRFLRALVKADTKVLDEICTKANINEATGAQGAYLVPEEFAAEILRLAPTYGVARRECRHVPMKYDVINFPCAGTTDITAHWTAEAGAIYTTDPTFGQVTMTINKLASIPKVTPELLADANVPVISYLTQLIAEAFAKAEDVQCFKGVGSPFTGAINATGTPTYPHIGGTGFETLSYQDIVKCPAYTYTQSLPNAKYFFHRSMIAHIRALITTAGAPVFPSAADAIVGYPMVAVEVLPGIGHAAYQTTATTYAIFGDFKRGMLMGERGTIEMKLLTEGTVLGDNLAEQDLVALRMIERVAFGVALPSAFVVIRSA